MHSHGDSWSFERQFSKAEVRVKPGVSKRRRVRKLWKASKRDVLVIRSDVQEDGACIQKRRGKRGTW